MATRPWEGQTQADATMPGDRTLRCIPGHGYHLLARQLKCSMTYTICGKKLDYL
jgi:hypothetical protein